MANNTITPQKRQKLINEVKEILIHHAAERKTISYGLLCRKVTAFPLSPTDPLLHEILGEISKSSMKEGKGMLSAVVVRDDTKMPGEGFFQFAIELGHRIENREKFFRDQIDLLHSKYRDPNILTF